MRTIFSLGVIAAIVYLVATEVPQVGAWFDKHNQGSAGTAVEQLSETQSEHIIARVAAERQLALDSMRQEIEELLEQLNQRNARSPAAPYLTQPRGQSPLQQGEQVDPGVTVVPATAPASSATGNTRHAYMSTEDRRRELLQMAQRLELRSLGIEE